MPAGGKGRSGPVYVCVHAGRKEILALAEELPVIFSSLNWSWPPNCAVQ